MLKLLTFGCSNTYGYGLDPTWKEYNNGDNPSKMAWPQVLGNALKRKTVNRSRPGSSNREILWRILNCDQYSSKDIVVILWTFTTRYALISEPGQLFPDQLSVPSWPGAAEVGPYYEKYKTVAFNEYDSAIESLHFIDYADRFLKDRVRYVMHYVSDNALLNLNEPYTQVKLISNGNKILNQHDKALDDKHPGAQAHAAFAAQISKDLRQLRKFKHE